MSVVLPVYRTAQYLRELYERLVAVLADRFGEVVSREELLAAGWPDGNASDAALRVHLTRLRKEIAPLGLEIATVRGFGHVMQEAQRPNGH